MARDAWCGDYNEASTFEGLMDSTSSQNNSGYANADVDQWLSRYRAWWEQRLDALHTEVASGKRERRSTV